MRLLVTGATGMLGQALMAEARVRGLDARGVARRGADISVDLTDDAALQDAIRSATPDVIINTAAITDLARCETHVEEAYRINARAVAVMAKVCAARSIRLCQISTDHYFTGGGARRHDEGAPVTLVNEYARTKYAGEAFAMSASGALVLRTNITGFRGDIDRPTFAEWAIAQLEGRHTINAFSDYYCSTVDVATFSAAAFDLLDKGAGGILNVASSEVSDKRTFIEALAEALGISGADIRTASVAGMVPRRADSNGLDVARAEALLGRALPGLTDVTKALVEEHRRRT